ncbi:fibroblast growth factor 6-like isoform X2 [Chiloscyllium plagiosum]|uniref:fibroblast growth factor 6-like isoform X2 n=1 Tax=Chiloscyllium plagiosum TaxID=36176 RepID=UPI001CB82E50|nr:fibroblast growth factor 6-like isoform X2 [Chiloscyllium plagiosum]
MLASGFTSKSRLMDKLMEHTLKTSTVGSLLMISTVELGVVSLYGVKAHAFIAMNSKGRLYATVNFNNECEFREILLPNRYNVYESKTYPGMYIALSKYGRAKRGSKVSPILRVTHFLPRL